MEVGSIATFSIPISYLNHAAQFAYLLVVYNSHYFNNPRYKIVMMKFLFQRLLVLMFVSCVRLTEADVGRKVRQWLSKYQAAHLAYPSCLSDNPLVFQTAYAAQAQGA